MSHINENHVTCYLNIVVKIYTCDWILWKDLVINLAMIFSLFSSAVSVSIPLTVLSIHSCVFFVRLHTLSTKFVLGCSCSYIVVTLRTKPNHLGRRSNTFRIDLLDRDNWTNHTCWKVHLDSLEGFCEVSPSAERSGSTVMRLRRLLPSTSAILLSAFDLPFCFATRERDV